MRYWSSKTRRARHEAASWPPRHRAYGGCSSSLRPSRTSVLCGCANFALFGYSLLCLSSEICEAVAADTRARPRIASGWGKRLVAGGISAVALERLELDGVLLSSIRVVGRDPLLVGRTPLAPVGRDASSAVAGPPALVQPKCLHGEPLRASATPSFVRHAASPRLPANVYLAAMDGLSAGS